MRRQAAAFSPDRVLLHYSVLSWANAGQPWAAPPLVATLRSLGLPTTAFLHEYIVPVSWRQPRSIAFGAAHPAALAVVLSVCDGAVVTTEHRARSLRAARWLPLRPVIFLPVFSNVEPLARPARPPSEGDVVLGVFGFGTPSYPRQTVIDAVARLRTTDPGVRLRLVGAPGPTDPAGADWSAAAARAGVSDLLEFTGVLDEPQLADALAAVDVMIFPDPGGPASRKTTLAAGLAHGLPIVAFYGPQGWTELCASDAVVLAPGTVDATAAALAPLVRDDHLRREQGDRARRFYTHAMAPEVSACALLAFVDRP
ncbi:MAG: glycosyltransferase family 4 protein [Acidimicrobiales bacterium]